MGKAREKPPEIAERAAGSTSGRGERPAGSRQGPAGAGRPEAPLRGMARGARGAAA